jgi:hypothetical protein
MLLNELWADKRNWVFYIRPDRFRVPDWASDKRRAMYSTLCTRFPNQILYSHSWVRLPVELRPVMVSVCTHGRHINERGALVAWWLRWKTGGLVKKTCPSATSFTTNPKQMSLRCKELPATKSFEVMAQPPYMIHLKALAADFARTSQWILGTLIKNCVEVNH